MFDERNHATLEGQRDHRNASPDATCLMSGSLGKAWSNTSAANFGIVTVRQTDKDVCQMVQRKKARQRSVYRDDNRTASGCLHFNG